MESRFKADARGALITVPCALKAAGVETLGGLPSRPFSSPAVTGGCGDGTVMGGAAFHEAAVDGTL